MISASRFNTSLAPSPIRRAIGFLCIILLAAGCQGTDSTESTADGEAALADTVQVLAQEMATAWSALKPEPYLNLYSDDVQFYFRGARSTRAEFEKQVRKIMRGYQTYTIEPINPQIEVLGEDAAVASFRY